MRSLVAKFDMAENHAIGEMQNLASEIQIKELKVLLASKYQRPQRLIFAINKMKEEERKKEEQDGKRGENSGHGEIHDSVYKENLRRLIDEVSKHKIILLTTRRTKEKLERALEISKKKENDTFEDVVRLEGEVGKLKPEAAQS